MYFFFLIYYFFYLMKVVIVGILLWCKESKSLWKCAVIET